MAKAVNGQFHQQMPQIARGPIDGASIALIDVHLAKFLKGLLFAISELTNGCTARKWEWSSIDPRSVDRGVVCDE